MLPLYALAFVPIADAATADASVPRYEGEPHPRKVSIAAGVGGSWIVGDNAAGYGGGLSERLVIDLPTGDLVAFTLELDHARHALADANAYFPGVSVPAGTITGFRDYLVIDAGFRFGLPVGAPPPDDRLRVVPYVRVGIGVAGTTTLLDASGFDGRVAMRSSTVWPAPSIAAGADLRIRRWIGVLPHLKTQVQVFEDVAESIGGPTRIGAEWRFQPALDVSINF